MLSRGKRLLIGYGYEQAEGTHLSVPNTINGDVRISISDIGGDLVSSSRNLFDPTKFPVTQTKNGVTVSRENDIITIDGTNNIGNATLYSAYFYLPSGNIRLSFRVIGGTFNNSVRVYLYQSGYIDGVVLLTGSGTTGSKTINISPSGNYRLAVYSQNGHSYNNCKIQIQLEFGSVTTPYTPFTGVDIVPITTTEHSIKTYKGFTQVYATEGQTLSGIFRIKKGG